MIISSLSVILFPFTSETTADLTTANDGVVVSDTTVGSFVVFPSLSSPSSLWSLTTSALTALVADTNAELITPPLSTAS